VAGCIITKFPFTWRNFATSLKYKRQEILVKNLITSLDVMEKARAKDTSSKGGEGYSSANMVLKNHNNGKGKTKSNKPNKTTNFKKKNNNDEMTCFVCVRQVILPRTALIERIAMVKRVMSTQ
jgi:hypothetical protein